MDICRFNDHYLNLLLDNLSKEANKINVLLGEHVNTFRDNLASNSLQLQILLPKGIFFNSKTLIDKSFRNILTSLVKTAIYRNISSRILDHFPQFFILPEFFSNSPLIKFNIIFQYCGNFSNQSFLEQNLL